MSLPDGITILQGNVIEQLRLLPDESVHSVVTSPPYLGLRKYKIEPQIWTACSYIPMAGLAPISFPGDPGCQHVWSSATRPINDHRNVGWSERAKEDFRGGGHTTEEVAEINQQGVACETCQLCGAWRGHLGNEPTPELYTAHLVSIFREMRRVLRSDGIFWLNLGDGYAGGGNNRGGSTLSEEQSSNKGAVGQVGAQPIPDGLHSGDMLGIPWRIAFALQADGWILRMDNIWAKVTMMPESVEGPRWQRHKVKVEDGWKPCPGCEKCDPHNGFVRRNGSWRPTKAHEYIFMFTKTAHYFGDGQAVREQAAASSMKRITQKTFNSQSGGEKDYGKTAVNASRSARRALENFAENPGHNLTSVWRLRPTMFKGKHFAVFPLSLPEKCIRASVSEYGVCAECGAPFLRVVDRVSRYKQREEAHAPSSAPTTTDSTGWEPPLQEELGFAPSCDCEPRGKTADAAEAPAGTRNMNRSRDRARRLGWMGLHGSKSIEERSQSSVFRMQKNLNEQRAASGVHDNPFKVRQTLGWKPSCEHVSKHVPATVLDPFCGSGTTLVVCRDLGLKGIGIELSSEYIEITEQRLASPTPQPKVKVVRQAGHTVGQLSLLE